MTNRSLAALVIATAILVGCGFFVVFRVLSPVNSQMRGAVALLESLEERGVEAGVVVLGTSLDRNALGPSGDLGRALSSDELTVIAANLSFASGSYDGFLPIMDEVWASAPDLLIVNPDIFLPRPRRWEISGRERVEDWWRGVAHEPIDAPFCPAVNMPIEEHLARVPPILAVSDDVLAQARVFVAEAHRRQIPILWFLPPRSEEWDNATDGRSVSVRRELLAAAADYETFGPLDTPSFGLNAFCDFSHLRLHASAGLRAVWIPQVSELIERLRS